MGLIDKLKSVAATAKDEIGSRLADQIGGTAEDRSPDPASTWDPEAEMAGVVRRGGLDPRTLITREEVARIAGHEVAERAPRGPFQSGGLCFEGSFVDLSYDGGGEIHTLSVFHAEDDSYEWNVDDWYQLIDGSVAEAIDGLGERACATYANVYAVQAGRGLGAVVTGDRVDEARSRQHAVEMLRIALTRL